MKSQSNNPRDSDDNADAGLIDVLAQYDEGLRRGLLDVSTRHDAGSAETPGEALQCLHFLERAWPRAEQTRAPTRIGRFEIVRVLGQGGFGIVYLAADPLLGRQVALKVPRLHALAEPRLRDRFRREARAAAALDHPNIIPVYESGEAGDVCYIASAYCNGPNLAQWLKEHPGGATARPAATLVMQLAEAVAYSHSKGVLHRDIKPGNVMLVPHETAGRTAELAPSPLQHVPPELGTPLSNFTARLGDFGLAKLNEDAFGGAFLSAGETGVSAMLGTPTYMSPEQAGGVAEAGAIGPTTDVYALGVMLYELLIGRPPFQGPNVADVLDQVRDGEPVPVRRLRRDVPRDLETVCLKCLEKSPARRYAEAGELRDDLQRFLEGESIRARPPGVAERGWKGVRRRPAAAGMAGVLIAAVCGFVAMQSRHNANLRDALHEAREMAYATDIPRAWRAYHEGDFSEFEQLIRRYRDGEPLAGYRGPEWYHLNRLTRIDGRELTQLPHSVYQVAFSPRGDRVALLGADAIVRILEYPSGRPLTEWRTGQVENNGGVFSADGETLWTTGDDGTLRAWNVSTHAERLPQPIVAHSNERVFDVLFDSRRNLLITCGTEGTIRAWDAESGEARGTLKGHELTVQSLAWHPDRDSVVSASNDDKVCLWNLDDLQSHDEINPTAIFDAKEHVRHAVVAGDGQTLAACSDELTLWNLRDDQQRVRVKSLNRCVRAAFDPSGRELYVLTEDGCVQHLELQRDEQGRLLAASHVATRRVHSSKPYSMVLGAKDGALVTSGGDGKVGVWQASSIRDEAAARTYVGEGIARCTFHPQSTFLAGAGPDGIYIWSIDTAQDAALLESTKSARHLGEGQNWRWVDVSPKGDLLAGGDASGTVQIWQISDFHPLAAAKLSDQSITALCFSHDGQRLAAAATTAADSVIVIDAHTGAIVDRIAVGRTEVAQFSPTDSLLAVTFYARTLRMYDWATRTVVWESDEFPKNVTCMAYSPDGQHLLCGGEDRVVRVFDARAGKLVHVNSRQRSRIDHLSISPDGRTIASASQEGITQLLHAATGELLMEYEAPPPPKRWAHVQFSPDGRWLANSISSGGIRLLPLK